MRIAQVAAFPFPSPQGSQVYVRGIARGLAARGHDVRLLCYAHGQGEVNEGYQIIRTPSFFGYNNMRAGPDWVKPILDVALAALVATQDVDIIHVHNYEAPLAGRLGRLGRKIPMVYSAHNTMSEELHLYFKSRFLQKIAKLSALILDRTVPRMADHAIAIRPESVSTLKDLQCPSVSCIPPGVSMADFDGVIPAVLPAGPWVVYAGNPDEYQNLDVLMEAMAQIPTVGLLMVSASPLGYWKSFGLSKLICVETQSFSEVCSYLAAADLAVLPRVSCTGFPMKLLNYLAMGLATVVAEGSAISIDGIVPVPNNNSRAMAQAISHLLSDPQGLELMGQAGKIAVSDGYSWDVQSRKLEEIYQNLLDNLL